MEACFSQLTLDVIGKAVFNYDFDALTTSSPVIQVCWRASCITAHIIACPVHMPYLVILERGLNAAHDNGKCNLALGEAKIYVRMLKLPWHFEGFQLCNLGIRSSLLQETSTWCAGCIHSSERDRAEGNGCAAAMEAVLLAPADPPAAQGHGGCAADQSHHRAAHCQVQRNGRCRGASASHPMSCHIHVHIRYQQDCSSSCAA